MLNADFYCAKINSDTISHSHNSKPIISKQNFSKNLNNYVIKNWELIFYYIVWISHSLAALLIAIGASNNSGKWLEHWTEQSSYIKGWTMDNSDAEWRLYRSVIVDTLVAFVVHSIVFHFAIRKLSTLNCSIFLVIFWTFLNWYLTSMKCLLFIGVYAVIVTSVTYFARSQLIAWVMSIIFLLSANNYAPFSLNLGIFYREYTFYLYTGVQILNYCLYLSQNPSVKLGWKEFFIYLEYLLYPMYSTTLIVLYEDFLEQMNQLKLKIKNQEQVMPGFRNVVWKSIRLIIWFFVFELILHFCRVNAFFSSPFTMLTSLSNYELSSIAYIAGQLFHVKYIIIFGVPSLFAQIDGLKPPGPPICISRVSKYSQMWRYFDQGLYQFLKNQVYIPLLKTNKQNLDNTLSVKLLNSLRPLVATSTVFMFVLTWHGMSSNFVYWVALSGVELLIEKIGHLILKNTDIQNRLCAANLKRLTAIGMIATVIPGIFGVFFFLGKAGFGDYIFSKVLFNGIKEQLSFSVHFNSAGFVLLHLYFLGYCFNNVCLHLQEVMPHSSLSGRKILKTE